jgi:hypothetical protein
MIGTILKIIAREASTYLDRDLGASTGKKSVVLHKPRLDDEGNKLDIPDNSVSVSLFNIEEDLTQRSAIFPKKVIDGKVYRQNPPVHLNLYIIFLANFPNDYESELNYTTKIIEFFQQKNTFTPEDTKGLAELNIEKLVFKLDNIPLSSENGAFWNLLNAKYLPYVIYRVSTLIVQAPEREDDTPLVEKVDIDAKPKKL